MGPYVWAADKVEHYIENVKCVGSSPMLDNHLIVVSV